MHDKQVSVTDCEAQHDRLGTLRLLINCLLSATKSTNIALGLGTESHSGISTERKRNNRWTKCAFTVIVELATN